MKPLPNLKPTFWQRLLTLFRPNRHAAVKQLAINFILAALVITGLHYGENLAWVIHLKDIMLDKVMSLHSDIESPSPKDRLVIWEIDETAHHQWGLPVLTPRDKLTALLKQAVNGGASVIAVDIGLSWSGDGCIHGPRPPACPSADLTADKELGEYLKSLNERTDAESPLVILTRTYPKPFNSETDQIEQRAVVGKAPSFLDEYLPVERNVFWAATFFQQEEYRIIRRWQLASWVCEEKQLTLVPSMQLLVALAQTHKAEKRAQVVQQFKQRLHQWASQFSCDTLPSTNLHELCSQTNCTPLTIELPVKPRVTDKTHTINLAGSRETERIIYRFAPAEEKEEESSANTRSLITIQSALEVLTQTPDVMGQIVLIGVTHEDSTDRHPIPIRHHEVPGIYVLANAIDTLLRFGQLTPESQPDKMIAAGLVIVITTLFFTYYEVLTAFLFSLVTVGLILFIWSMYQLSYGVEIDIALPIFVITALVQIWHWVENWFHLKGRVTGGGHHS